MRSARAWAAAVLGAASACGPPKDPSPPNVLLIVIDALRADRLGIYGATRPTSPHIDALARDATVFENARSAGPWTVPAMASLMTGTYPSHHGNLGWLPDGRAPVLTDDLVTLAEALRDRGYRTHGVSGQPFASADFGLAQGFRGFVSARGRYAPKDDGAVTRGALEWLRPRAAAFSAGGRARFFLFVHYLGPHSPYAPSPELQRAVLGRVLEATPFVRRLNPLRRLEYYNTLAMAARDGQLEGGDVACLSDLYDAEIRGTDGEVGLLTAALHDLGLDGNTMVVITADHGESFLEHGTMLHQQNLYDELLRVPLIVRWPGQGGRRSAAAASAVDVVPTVLDTVGAPALEGLAGRSLRGRVPEGATVFAEGDETQARLKVVHGALAAILDPRAPQRDQLFDLAADPAERVNLAAERPSDLAALRALAHDFRGRNRRARAALKQRSVPLSPDTREALGALGYVR